MDGNETDRKYFGSGLVLLILVFILYKIFVFPVWIFGLIMMLIVCFMLIILFSIKTNDRYNKK